MYQIRTLRIEHGLSQKDVAAYLHITQQCYSKIETGRMDITGERLLLLAKLYGVTTDYILGLSEKES